MFPIHIRTAPGVIALHTVCAHTRQDSITETFQWLSTALHQPTTQTGYEPCALATPGTICRTPLGLALTCSPLFDVLCAISRHLPIRSSRNLARCSAPSCSLVRSLWHPKNPSQSLAVVLLTHPGLSFIHLPRAFSPLLWLTSSCTCFQPSESILTLS